MKRTSIHRAIAPGVVALAMALSACGGDSNAESGEVGENLSGELAIGGASSQEAAQSAWIVGFGEAAPDLTVTYEPIGSGGGRENFISGGYATAGTDSYLTDDEGELTAATERCHGTHPIEIPNYISPIAIIHNVEGVDELRLSPATLAGIFTGEITSWSDPAIAADNPETDLPDARINAVHRSDESGTTENFTDYLDTAAGDVWTAGVVETWPGEYGGEGAKGTSGVVKVVSESPNTIAYADASQAGELGQALIKVGDEYVGPSAEAAAKVLEVSPRVEGRPEVDLAFDLAHDTAESGVYPIVLTSYLVACQEYEDQQTADLVQGYLTYVLSEEGQQFASEEAGSAPLSPALREEALGVVEQISAAG